MPHLQGALFLNACNSERIGLEIHRALPHLSIVCWRGLALDAAAKAFSKGFYAALAAGSQVPVATAFRAGRASLQAAGFVEGDPEDYLHPLGHPHRTPERTKEPNWRACHGCCPPVHGEVRLVAGGGQQPAGGGGAPREEAALEPPPRKKGCVPGCVVA